MFNEWKEFSAGPTPPSGGVNTLDHLIGWLEKKNPNEQYDYPDGQYCLLSQYYRENGVTFYVVTSDSLHLAPEPFGIAQRLPTGFDKIARGTYLSSFFGKKGDPAHESWTFGKALERAKREKAKRELMAV